MRTLKSDYFLKQIYVVHMRSAAMGMFTYVLHLTNICVFIITNWSVV